MNKNAEREVKAEIEEVIILQGVSDYDEKLELISKKIEEIKIKTNNKPRVVDHILNSIGFTNYHILLIICCGLIYFSEGDQLFSLNMLLPTLNVIFKYENQFLKTTLASLLFFGYIMATFFNGYLSKIYGRRLSINLFLVLFSLLSILIGVIENIYFISFCRFSIGFCMGIVIPQYITNLSEFLPSENKEIIILSMYIFYRFGIIYFILCFWLLGPDREPRKWNETFLLASIPVITITILSKIYFRDSPKLLLSNNELYKAIDVLNEISDQRTRIKLRIDSHGFNLLIAEYFQKRNESVTESSLIDLFKTNYLRLTVVTSMIFLCSSTVNFISIYSLPIMLQRKHEEDHSANMSFLILITQTVTIPAILLSALICRYIGRKNTMLIGFIFCFIFSAIPCIFMTGIIISISFVNFFIAITICPIKLYVIEAFPTHMRDQALSFCFCVSKIGDLLIPFICNASLRLNTYGPMEISSILCIVGFLSALFLPFDTLGYYVD